jgi:hypothetical protein
MLVEEIEQQSSGALASSVTERKKIMGTLKN